MIAGTVCVALILSPSVRTQNSPDIAEARRVGEQMRGMKMTLQPAGYPTEREARRREITRQLHALGPAAIAALIEAFRDADVQMRQNAALALSNLGGGISAEARPALDIRVALSAVIDATRDVDPDVRGWAAHAILYMGAAAEPAIPALLTLLRDPEVGPRNMGCAALGRIGPAARVALPALREALNDPHPDVRRFAESAIKRIEGK